MPDTALLGADRAIGDLRGLWSAAPRLSSLRRSLPFHRAILPQRRHAPDAGAVHGCPAHGRAPGPQSRPWRSKETRSTIRNRDIPGNRPADAPRTRAVESTCLRCFTVGGSKQSSPRSAGSGLYSHCLARKGPRRPSSSCAIHAAACGSVVPHLAPAGLSPLSPMPGERRWPVRVLSTLSCTHPQMFRRTHLSPFGPILFAVQSATSAHNRALERLPGNRKQCMDAGSCAPTTQTLLAVPPSGRRRVMDFAGHR